MVIFFLIYTRNIECNENEAENYFEKSFSKVMFDSAGNHNQSADRIINGHLSDGASETTTSKKKVNVIRICCYILIHNI